MNRRLAETPSKQEYRQYLNETISFVEELLAKTPFELYEEILAELRDIKSYVVDYPIISGWDQVNERFSLGSIATKNLEEGTELRDRLCDVFAGATEYAEMKE